MAEQIQEKTMLVQKFLDQGRAGEAAQEVTGLHEADLAVIIEGLSPSSGEELFSALDASTAAEVVVELSDSARDRILASLDTQRLTDLLDDMPSDEATDLIADLPTAQADEVLGELGQEDSDEVRTLLQYPEDSAGGLMQLELVSAKMEWTVRDVVERIRELHDEVEDLHYVFVVDRKNILRGMIPLVRVILGDPLDTAGMLMQPCPVIVSAEEDQESVAHKFRRYDMISAPVVDDLGRLIGRITVDDVVEVMEEEIREDLARMSGTSPQEDVFQSGGVLRASRLRLPWLISNLVGGLVSGGLLWLFKVALADAMALIAFIPVIMAMAGNVGVQSSTIIVRGIAVGQVDSSNMGRIFSKEFRVALIIGLVCGFLVGLVARLWSNNPWLGLVVGLAMACAITVASLMGVFAPALFKKLNVDPAISSGPVVTTVNDITGILIYFGIATLFYRLLIT